jgi:hypothetical protein
MGAHIAMHPWTADLVTRNIKADLTAQHERALSMRFRRFQQRRGSYPDLIDIPRHLAALHRYDNIPDVAPSRPSQSCPEPSPLSPIWPGL